MLHTRRQRILVIFLTAAITICSALHATARKRLNDDERQRALTEMRNFKHNVLTRTLELSKDQQNKFFDVYDQMDDELFAIGEETRELERKTMRNAQATDTEINAASRALFEQKKREAEVELKYYDRLADILTPRQLLKLKSAERRIAMMMASYHGQAKKQRRQGAN